MTERDLLRLYSQAFTNRKDEKGEEKYPNADAKSFINEITSIKADVDYMMGHTVDIYHDIQMLGVEKLRNIYASSGLCIRPKTKVSKIDALKEIIRAWGMNPEQILTREALNQPARTYISPEDHGSQELQILSKALRELIRQDAGKS